MGLLEVTIWDRLGPAPKEGTGPGPGPQTLLRLSAVSHRLRDRTTDSPLLRRTRVASPVSAQGSGPRPLAVWGVEDLLPLAVGVVPQAVL